jgi:hypothetical protein
MVYIFKNHGYLIMLINGFLAVINSVPSFQYANERYIGKIRAKRARPVLCGPVCIGCTCALKSAPASFKENTDLELAVGNSYVYRQPETPEEERTAGKPWTPVRQAPSGMTVMRTVRQSAHKKDHHFRKKIKNDHENKLRRKP